MDHAKSSQAIVPAAAKSTSTAVVAHSGKKARFVVPKPGVNGAVANVLEGKRFVLTGTFPEVGGGAGLNQGKDRTKEMIESFGGKVTSAVSGKTDFLLVGRDPGRSKVSQADKKDVPLIDLIALHKLLMGQATIEATAAAEAPKITNFSAGCKCFSFIVHIICSYISNPIHEKDNILTNPIFFSQQTDPGQKRIAYDY